VSEEYYEKLDRYTVLPGGEVLSSVISLLASSMAAEWLLHIKDFAPRRLIAVQSKSMFIYLFI